MKQLKREKANSKTTDGAVVEESIRPYAIAEKLRTLRLRRSMGLAQLAEHTGYPVTSGKCPDCSNVANTYSHCASLQRWARLFLHRSKKATCSVDHPSCFSRPTPTPLPFRGILRPWTSAVKERKLNGFLAHFHTPPTGKVMLHFHPGVEFLYLVEGELEMSIGVDTFRLSAGDSVYFDSLQKHSYRSFGGRKPGTAVVVTTGLPLEPPRAAYRGLVFLPADRIRSMLLHHLVVIF